MGQSRAGTDSAIECSWKAVIVINVMGETAQDTSFLPLLITTNAQLSSNVKKKRSFILPKLNFDIQAQYDLIREAG